MAAVFSARYNIGLVITLAAKSLDILGFSKFHKKEELEAARYLHNAGFVEMYNYIKHRVLVHQRIDRCIVDDIVHDLYFIMWRVKFFAKIPVKIRGIKGFQRFLKIQRWLDFCVDITWKHYIETEKSDRFFEEGELDPKFVEDITSVLDPEAVAIMKWQREVLVDKLVTAPEWCRIPKDKYESMARKLLRVIFKPNSHAKSNKTKKLTKENRNENKHFVRDYVRYSIRKILLQQKITIDDLYYRGLHDAYVEPSFSELLSKKLSVKNIYDEVAYARRASKGNEQDNQKFLFFD